MTKILFLDDQERRVEMFRSKYPDAAYCKTSVSCIKYLSSSDYDLVSLDHDLGNGDSGMNVAVWIRENHPSLWCIVIHSTNMIESLRMLEIVREAGYFAEYLPFNSLEGGLYNL